MNRAEKQALATLLIREAGNIVEFWEEKRDSAAGDEILQGVTTKQVARQLAVWLKDLPGTNWDARLADTYEVNGKMVIQP